jgi:hypothetical protein
MPLPRRFGLPVLMAAALAVAGCAPVGIADDPVARVFQWPQIMAGEDIARDCATGGGERWRFVHNAVYTEQVRVYDIAAGAVETRVFDRLNLLDIDIDRFFRGARSTVALAPQDLQRLVAAVESDLARAARPGDHLRSDRFFWTVAACRAGGFRIAGFAYPADGSIPFAFPAEIARFDRSGRPLNPPRAFERDIMVIRDYYPNRMTGDIDPKFVLRVSETGIRPGF